MAQTLFFEDGSTEAILGPPVQAFARIIRERLGDDCERMFLKLVQEHDDYDLNEANNVNSALEDELDELRSDLDEARDAYDAIRADKRKLSDAARLMKDDLKSAITALEGISNDVPYLAGQGPEAVRERLLGLEKRLRRILSTDTDF